MNKRDKVRVKHEKPRGILNIHPAYTLDGHSRYWPSGDLAPFIEHYWIVRWDVIEPRVVETIPHPSIHMVLESSRPAEIVGVMRRRFSRVLEGRGRVVGTKFYPGGFRPFVQQAVSAFTDSRISLHEVFDGLGRDLRDRVLSHEGDRESIAIIEEFLRGFRPLQDESMALAGRVAARIADDRGIARVDQLARVFHTTVRQLQRLFSEYVGVSPKWVIQRYRLLEAAQRVSAGTEVVWADLALELGYADQAHFIRDFKRLLGRSPAEYAKCLERGEV